MQIQIEYWNGFTGRWETATVPASWSAQKIADEFGAAWRAIP